MKRATISLPEELAREVEREAHTRRVSVSEVAREALREHLDRRVEDSLPFIGIGRSGKRDTARRAEEILAREWGDARGR
jgi:Arc/MetJ-type ribon-helix-helix transcriptional regulator